MVENKPDKQKAIVSAEVRETYSGPLPHPRHLKEYEAIYPGAAKIIFDMAQSQREHRQTLERKVIESNITNERTGIFFAFILTAAIGVYGVAEQESGLGDSVIKSIRSVL
jgi:uncharacterized membrane protein